MKKNLKSSLFNFVFALIAVSFMLSLQGCTTDGGCDGTIFVNDSTEDIIVSASSVSQVQFETFIFGPGEEVEVCGNDTDSIDANYEWPNGDTANLGLTNSAADLCIFLLENHTAISGDCI